MQLVLLQPAETTSKQGDLFSCLLQYNFLYDRKHNLSHFYVYIKQSARSNAKNRFDWYRNYDLRIDVDCLLYRISQLANWALLDFNHNGLTLRM